MIKHPESNYYAPAYYKLAWSYYRNDQFEDAVKCFKQLIEYSDQRTEEGLSPFELRDEAVQYILNSLISQLKG